MSALSIKEAAAELGLSYGTVYTHKEKLGFFKVGAQWRIWPEQLKAAAQAYNDPRPPSHHPEVEVCQSENEAVSIILTSARQAARDFAALQARQTARRHRSTTTA